MAQFRSGVLPLEIETGRFKNSKDKNTGQIRKLKFDERICSLCENNEVEDEFHFVMKCEKFARERRILMNRLRNKFGNFDTLEDNEAIFRFIMREGWRECIDYVNNAWYVRKKLAVNAKQNKNFSTWNVFIFIPEFITVNYGCVLRKKKIGMI